MNDKPELRKTKNLHLTGILFRASSGAMDGAAMHEAYEIVAKYGCDVTVEHNGHQFVARYEVVRKAIEDELNK